MIKLLKPKWLRKLLCRHRTPVFIRNIHGDEIVEMGYKRSMWSCPDCGSLLLGNKVHKSESSGFLGIL